MPSYDVVIVLVAGALVGLAMLAGAGVWSWGCWVALKRAELARAPVADTPHPVAGRIELADLRERVRKLEAIAAGVEL